MKKAIEGLIQAGVDLDGAAVLAGIETWFDKLYKRVNIRMRAEIRARARCLLNRNSSLTQ